MLAYNTALIILLFFGYFCALVAAQTPTDVGFMAYATVEGKALYVQGGRSGSAIINQFFALDLTQPSWNTSSPPWKALSTGTGSIIAPTDMEHGMTVSKDNQNLIIWGFKTGVSIYNIPTNTWTVNTPLPSGSSTNVDGIRIVTDPGTGIMYAPSGANQWVDMAKIEINSNGTATVTAIPMPKVYVGWQTNYYSLVWSTQRNSMLIYGGGNFHNKTAEPFFLEFFPTNSSWNQIGQFGDYPGDLNSQCMVPAYNGSLMVVFGGEDIKFNAFGNLYYVNMSTLIWTKISTVDPPSQNRSDMACTVIGDNFIAWGGDQNFTTGSWGTPVIYNMKTNLWTNEYVASFSSSPGGGSSGSTSGSSGSSSGSSSGASSGASSGGSGTSGSTSKSSLPAIIGGSVGAVVVVAVGIFILYRRRSTHAGQRHSNESKVSLSVPSSNDQDLELKKVDPIIANTDIRRVRAPEGTTTSSVTRAPEGGNQDYFVQSGSDSNTLAGSPVSRHHQFQSARYFPSEVSSPSSPHTLTSNTELQLNPTIRSPQGLWHDNTHSISTPSDNGNSSPALLKEQIELMRAQYEQQYREQQEHLEQVRMQQQAQLEILRSQLEMVNQDPNVE
ncbi:hypothetical protein BGZ46_000728 [Entomortierella lignicola]|nr:hypothetical protein BGZ46_000728 [Entomortierella lignicola]